MFSAERINFRVLSNSLRLRSGGSLRMQKRELMLIVASGVWGILFQKAEYVMKV